MVDSRNPKRRRKARMMAIALAAVLGPQLNALASPYDEVIFLGDSLTDTGAIAAKLFTGKNVLEARSLMSYMASTFNDSLNSQLADYRGNLVALDVHDLLNEVIDRPQRYGLRNVTAPACGTEAAFWCGRASLSAIGDRLRVRDNTTGVQTYASYQRANDSQRGGDAWKPGFGNRMDMLLIGIDGGVGQNWLVGGRRVPGPAPRHAGTGRRLVPPWPGPAVGLWPLSLGRLGGVVDRQRWLPELWRRCPRVRHRACPFARAGFDYRDDLRLVRLDAIRLACGRLHVDPFARPDLAKHQCQGLQRVARWRAYRNQHELHRTDAALAGVHAGAAPAVRSTPWRLSVATLRRPEHRQGRRLERAGGLPGPLWRRGAVAGGAGLGSIPVLAVRRAGRRAAAQRGGFFVGPVGVGFGHRLEFQYALAAVFQRHLQRRRIGII